MQVQTPGCNPTSGRNTVSATPKHPSHRQLPVDMPIADKLQSQDSRLHSQHLQEGQKEQKAQAKSDKDSLTQSLSSMSVHFAASMGATQQAHQRQQEQLFQGMADLKAIVVAACGWRRVTEEATQGCPIAHAS